MTNLIQVSKATGAKALPVKPSTLYKWKHLGKFPTIFIKMGGFLFVDIDALNELLKAGRAKK